ncbi:MAG: phosphate propanoyltransferase [Clostridiales Family XIII bacterium]|jgi:propanediol utilization protein|nr:phosphate propanoyltransferase [Clostridiales Family XIII bacterium]
MTGRYSEDELVKIIAEAALAVISRVNGSGAPYAPVGVSNRHVHLGREDMDTLFGRGSELTVRNPVGQPGQFAAAETVTLQGPKGSIGHVRILGPFRPETQIEISLTDARALGIDSPIVLSGLLEGTPGIGIAGSVGSVAKKRGVITALRHVHMLPSTAKKWGLKNGEEVEVKVDGDRGGIMSGVIVRAADNSELELHVDVDEANAFHLKNGDRLEIIKKS